MGKKGAKFMISKMEKIFLLLIILASGSLISVDYSIIKILLVFTFVILLVKRDIYIINDKKLLLLLLVGFILWTAQAIIYFPSSEVLSDTLRTSLLFIIMMLYANSYKEKNFARVDCIYNILMVLTIIADILFIMLCANISLPTINTSISRETVFYLQNLVGGNPLGFVWLRNSGVFWEPGLFQVFLNFMLIWTLYRKKDKRFLYTVIVVFSILSTGSVMGYIIMLAIFCIYAFFNNEKIYIKIGIVFLGTLAVVILAPYAIGIIIDKFSTESFEIRSLDFFRGIDVFLQKPILGYGITNKAYENQYAFIYGYARGSSNGLIAALVSFGTVGASVMMTFFVRFAKKCAATFGNAMVIQLIIWLILSLMNEPIAVVPFMFFLMGVGFSKTDRSVGGNTLNLVKFTGLS